MDVFLSGGLFITINIRAKATTQKIHNKNNASEKINRCRGGLMKKIGSRWLRAQLP
jgi:hypothetical protein